jgi:hypothetical protein
MQSEQVSSYIAIEDRVNIFSDEEIVLPASRIRNLEKITQMSAIVFNRLTKEDVKFLKLRRFVDTNTRMLVELNKLIGDRCE